MHAVEAIYDGINFTPIQPIFVKGNYKVIITFLEPVDEEPNSEGAIGKHPRSQFIGSWKDQIWMSEDFNEPLEEMKEYME